MTVLSFPVDAIEHYVAAACNPRAKRGSPARRARRVAGLTGKASGRGRRHRSTRNGRPLPGARLEAAQSGPNGDDYHPAAGRAVDMLSQVSRHSEEVGSTRLNRSAGRQTYPLCSCIMARRTTSRTTAAVGEHRYVSVVAESRPRIVARVMRVEAAMHVGLKGHLESSNSVSNVSNAAEMSFQRSLEKALD